MIVITKQQKDKWISLRTNLEAILSQRGIDIDPIELTDGTFAFSENVLTSPMFQGLLPQIKEALGNLSIKQVSENEYLWKQSS